MGEVKLHRNVVMKASQQSVRFIIKRMDDLQACYELSTVQDDMTADGALEVGFVLDGLGQDDACPIPECLQSQVTITTSVDAVALVNLYKQSDWAT